MKALLTFFYSATGLTAAVVSSGCHLDAATLFSLTIASSLAGLCVSDYGRKSNHRTPVVPAARLAVRRPRTSAGFASVIIFETTCA